MSEILKALNWRYATQVFDQNKKVSENDLNELLETMRLSPSSFGLQPWKFIVVENKELRKEIREVAFNQPKVTDASHLIVLCSKTDITEEYIKQYIKDTAETRNISIDSLKGFEDMMINFRKLHNNESIKDWAKKQTYIALGILLQTAAIKGIDAGPMEGFDPNGVDEILNLKKEDLTSTVLCAIGYRSKEDKTSNYKKVRHSISKAIETRK
ncbi:NAD(P)H-dependent oxidoreductase [Candidatus Pacearchaeota archaeon]|nr:NAD(P)H-dependent oxidoreductase [Candidatus Pacearchaeota archaeon]